MGTHLRVQGQGLAPRQTVRVSRSCCGESTVCRQTGGGSGSSSVALGELLSFPAAQSPPSLVGTLQSYCGHQIRAPLSGWHQMGGR